MLPDWFNVVAMKSSLAAIRVIICIAENGQPEVTERGQSVITASISCRDFQRLCRLSLVSVVAGIRQATDAGWLSVRRDADPRAAATYSLPITLPVKESITPGVTETLTRCVKESATATVTENITLPVKESLISPEPPGDSPNSLWSRLDDSSPEDARGAKECETRSVKETVLPHGGGNGGGDPHIVNSNLITNDHHHHEDDVLQKLERYGFGDAVRFVSRHDPDRIKAAIEYVESLPGIRNQGAFIRRTVESPDEVPPPCDQNQSARHHPLGWAYDGLLYQYRKGRRRYP